MRNDIVNQDMDNQFKVIRINFHNSRDLSKECVPFRLILLASNFLACSSTLSSSRVLKWFVLMYRKALYFLCHERDLLTLSANLAVDDIQGSTQDELIFLIHKNSFLVHS